MQQKKDTLHVCTNPSNSFRFIQAIKVGLLAGWCPLFLFFVLKSPPPHPLRCCCCFVCLFFRTIQLYKFDIHTEIECNFFCKQWTWLFRDAIHMHNSKDHVSHTQPTLREWYRRKNNRNGCRQSLLWSIKTKAKSLTRIERTNWAEYFVETIINGYFIMPSISRCYSKFSIAQGARRESSKSNQ